MARYAKERYGATGWKIVDGNNHDVVVFTLGAATPIDADRVVAALNAVAEAAGKWSILYAAEGNVPYLGGPYDNAEAAVAWARSVDEQNVPVEQACFDSRQQEVYLLAPDHTRTVLSFETLRLGGRNDLQGRIDRALDLITRYGGTDEAHHLHWVVDQVLRALAGGDYDKIVATLGGHDNWDKGITP